MNLYAFILSFFLLIFSGCNDEMKINYSINEVNKIAKHRYGLFPVGSGVNAPDKLEGFIFDYGSYLNPNVFEARELIIKLVEDCIAKLADTISTQHLANKNLNEENFYLQDVEYLLYQQVLQYNLQLI